MKRAVVMIALAIAIALVLVPVFAVADDATTVSAAPWFEVVRPYVREIISAVVLALLGWVTAQINRYLGVEIEAKHREAIHRAVMTGVAAALDRAGVAAASATVDVKNQVVADAVRWAEKSVPDAIKRIGATPEMLAQVAASKITILAESPSSPLVPK